MPDSCRFIRAVAEWEAPREVALDLIGQIVLDHLLVKPVDGWVVWVFAIGNLDRIGFDDSKGR